MINRAFGNPGRRFATTLVVFSKMKKRFIFNFVCAYSSALISILCTKTSYEAAEARRAQGVGPTAAGLDAARRRRGRRGQGVLAVLIKRFVDTDVTAV